MAHVTAYEIVIRGRASARILRPMVDDFTVDHSSDGITRLRGDIRDASHLHGVMAHLTSVGAEVVAIAPAGSVPALAPNIGSPSAPHTLEDPMPTSKRTTTATKERPATAHAAGKVRAVVHDEFGGPDVLHLGEVDRPVVGKDEVLVDVRAAGLDRGTWHLVAGKPYAIRMAGFGVRRPRYRVPGTDLAGVVVEVGPDVTRFQAGDEVYGTTRGSFAELVAAPEKKLAHKPKSLTFEEASAVPVSGETALQGLCDVGRIEAGQSVLITGASGGVGTFAVQIAKAMGAEVTAVCSAAKADLVRSIGANHVLDYRRDDVADGSRRYDLVFDIAGNTSLRRWRRALEKRGTLVLVGGEDNGPLLGGTDRLLRATLLSPFVSQRLTWFTAKERFETLDRLTALLDDVQITPIIDRTYPLAEAAEALRRLDAGEARGKIVITR